MASRLALAVPLTVVGLYAASNPASRLTPVPAEGLLSAPFGVSHGSLSLRQGQRGSNENTNLLLRQYFPRGTDLSGYSQAQLDQVALRLNQRPRKTLGFETPASKLQASVASTV